jgi:site-specific recombinase XerD
MYSLECVGGNKAAPLTRKAYLSDLRELVDFLTERAHLTFLSQVSLFHLERFLASLESRGLSGNYRRRKAAAIRSFFAFCAARRFISVNPSLELIPPAQEETEPRLLTEAEYTRLVAVAQASLRDAAIIEVLLQTGIQLSELARLRLPDVQLPERIGPEPDQVGSITITGKGKKARSVTLNWKACQALDRYLTVRPETPYTEIFITKFGTPISPRAIENVVTKYVELAGIEGASVQTLRHTFAAAHVRQKTSLKVLKKALGHTHLAATSRYVELVSEEMNRELQEHAL